MTDQQLQQTIKETVQHAKDSFFKENSNLVDMLLHRMEPAIEKSIEKHVNGKLTTLSNKFDSYVIDDMAWKKEITPQIQAVKNLQGFGKVTLYIVGFFTAILGLIALTFSFFKDKIL